MIRISENALVHYQKVFLVIVSDNSKLTVIKSGKYETKSECDCMKEGSASSAHLNRKIKKMPQEIIHSHRTYDRPIIKEY